VAQTKTLQDVFGGLVRHAARESEPYSRLTPLIWTPPGLASEVCI
jgi:hypothetical protein